MEDFCDVDFPSRGSMGLNAGEYNRLRPESELPYTIEVVFSLEKPRRGASGPWTAVFH
jgi:hypothetical protein